MWPQLRFARCVPSGPCQGRKHSPEPLKNKPVTQSHIHGGFNCDHITETLPSRSPKPKSKGNAFASPSSFLARAQSNPSLVWGWPPFGQPTPLSRVLGAPLRQGAESSPLRVCGPHPPLDPPPPPK